MTGLLFLFGAFLALGLFFIAASILRLPKLCLVRLSRNEKLPKIWKPG